MSAGKIVSSTWAQGVDVHWRVSNRLVATLEICLISIGKNNYQCKFSKHPLYQTKSRGWSRGGKDSAIALGDLHSADSEQAGKWCNCRQWWTVQFSKIRVLRKSIIEAPAFNGWSQASSLRTWRLSWSLKEAEHSQGRGDWLQVDMTTEQKPSDKQEVSKREIEKGIILNIRWDSESRQVIRKISN